MIGFNVCYAEGAPGFCTNNAVFTLYNSNNSVGAGWIADGVFANGTQIELTRVWSALAGYEHIWNPKWRTSFFGGYVNVELRQQCDRPDPGAPARRGGGMRRRRDRARSEHDPAPPGQQLQPRLRLLGSRHPDAVEPGAAARYRPRSALLQAQHRLQRPRRRARVGLAAPGPRSSTTRTYGPRCSAGSVTSIHDRLSDPGKLQAPGGQPPGVLLVRRAPLCTTSTRPCARTSFSSATRTRAQQKVEARKFQNLRKFET